MTPALTSGQHAAPQGAAFAVALNAEEQQHEVLFTGHRGTSVRHETEKCGTAHPNAKSKEKRRASSAAWKALREHRKDTRINPWSPEAVALKNAARQKLAAGLCKAGLEGRAQDAKNCGHASVLYVDSLGAWAWGGLYKLATAQVRECGNRNCPTCAARAARRNRARITERVEHCDRVASMAIEGTLVDHLRPALDGALADVDAVGVLWGERCRDAASAPDARAKMRADVEGWRWRRGRRAGWGVRTVRPLTVSLVVDEERDTVGGLFAALSQRHGATFVDGLGLVDDGATLDAMFSGVACSDEWRGQLAASRARAETTAALRKAERDQRRALAREDAARLLHVVDHPRRLAAAAQHLRAGLLRMLADVEALRVAVDVKPDGPVQLRARELARVPGQLARAATGCTRALASLTQQDEAARERFNASHRRRMARAHTDAVEEAGRHWRRIVGGDLGAVDLDAPAAMEFLRQRIRDQARAAAARAQLWRSRDVRFLTLTQQDIADETAGQALRRVRAAVSAFQRATTWTQHVAGSIIKFEIERSNRSTRLQKARKNLDTAEVLSGLGFVDDAEALKNDAHHQVRRERRRMRGQSWWHAHAHLAVASGYWSQAEVSSSWALAQRESAQRLLRSYEEQHEHAKTVGVREARSQFATAIAKLKAPMTTRAAEKARSKIAREEARALAIDPHADILRAWLGRDDKTPSIVDIQRPRRGVAGVLDELTKYITKPLSIAKLGVDEVADLVTAIAGRRLLRCTGALRGIVLEDDQDETAKTIVDDESVIGDGYDKPMAAVDDASSHFGKRGVYLDAARAAEKHGVVGRWRSDAEAQEEYRRTREIAWAVNHARRRGRMENNDV